ncbi:hypothetical protein ACJRO7_026217 [Eucalyptus globulus]|uniref:Uncharacterized protein n=1 Tax=Eucalyptus globulus TaxID=34317 RepID=A0ABD3KDJ7_EUCGL
MSSNFSNISFLTKKIQYFCFFEGAVFDSLGIDSHHSSGLNSTRKSFLGSYIDFGYFFRAPLPWKFLKLLGYLALSRLGINGPLGGLNRDGFAGNLDQNSLLSTLYCFSGGCIGRLWICSLGIVPFMKAQIVFQLLAEIYPKLQDLKESEGQVLYLCPYIEDLSTEWTLSSVTTLMLGSVFTTCNGERISDLKIGNGIAVNIYKHNLLLTGILWLNNHKLIRMTTLWGHVAIILSSVLLVLGIVYEAGRKIPLNYASRYTSRSGGLQKSAYLPFKVNSSGVMPIVFSASSLPLPSTVARFVGLAALKKAAVALNPGGSLYLPTNMLLIAFFNYYYTFLHLGPDDMSEQLKRQGVSIPLIQLGKTTAAFKKNVLCSRGSIIYLFFKDFQFYCCPL